MSYLIAAGGIGPAEIIMKDKCLRPYWKTDATGTRVQGKKWFRNQTKNI